MPASSFDIQKPDKTFKPRISARRNALRNLQQPKPVKSRMVTETSSAFDPIEETTVDIPTTNNSTIESKDQQAENTIPSAPILRGILRVLGKQPRESPRLGDAAEIVHDNTSQPSQPTDDPMNAVVTIPIPTTDEVHGHTISSGSEQMVRRSTRSKQNSLVGTKRKQPSNTWSIVANTTNQPSSAQSAPLVSRNTRVQIRQPRKKRKTTPHAAPALIFAQGRASTAAVLDAVGPTESISQDPNYRSNDDLLRNATSQLETVSNLAAEISNGARTIDQLSKPKTIEPISDTQTKSQNTVKVPEVARASPRRSKPKRKSMAEVAADVVAEAAGLDVHLAEISRNRRDQTPEDAEEHEIEPTEITMGDLCTDTNLGKKSLTEAAMQNVDWDEIKKRRKEEAAERERLRRAGKKAEKRAHEHTAMPEPAEQIVVPLMLMGNDIVLAEGGREIDRHASVIDAAADEQRTIVSDDRITKRINSATVGQPRGLQNIRTRWDEETTEKFYKGLRMFGTDFMMISNMFPGLTRRHIKLKYVKEERLNPIRIHENLAAHEPVNLKAFEEETQKVFEDPKKIEEEIKAEEQKLRDEDEKRKELEKAGRHPEEDNILQSREQGTAEPVDGDIRETIEGNDESGNENRFTSIAAGIVEEATAPKKKPQRKAAMTKRAKTVSKKAQKAMEGTVEILGNVEDVPR